MGGVFNVPTVESVWLALKLRMFLLLANDCLKIQLNTYIINGKIGRHRLNDQMILKRYNRIIFTHSNGSNKYNSTRRQIGHITVNETHDSRPMRYNKRDLYPDVFYGILYISGAVLELYLQCFRKHQYVKFIDLGIKQ